MLVTYIRFKSMRIIAKDFPSIEVGPIWTKSLTCFLALALSLISVPILYISRMLVTKDSLSYSEFFITGSDRKYAGTNTLCTNSFGRYSASKTT